MRIIYKEDKNFTKEDVKTLFLSVDWISGKYPNKLYKALLNSATVITAWHEDRLIGLVRALDDGELTAYLHYVLVDPAYQGYGIASELVDRVKQKYKDYMYINLTPEDSGNIPFYEKKGFTVIKNGAAMQLYKQIEDN